MKGSWSKAAGRTLRADFNFNRKFTGKQLRDRAGSWTLGAQPDYTISIWPGEYSAKDAEANELMVHIHFDAKYRVERVREILGDETDDETLETEVAGTQETRTAAKYADLLKMHAYRDAVRRTAGAYVLYPGTSGEKRQFRGFHEVLPGLGAFPIWPDEHGKAQGLEKLSRFLDEVIEHLSNRTTVRERVTYHLADAYESKETAVQYAGLHLDEGDRLFGSQYRAAPPAEHMILVAWYEDDAQVPLARQDHGLAFVRLGTRRGSL